MRPTALPSWLFTTAWVPHPSRPFAKGGGRSKNRWVSTHPTTLCAFGVALAWCAGVASAQTPMGTAFTYQGQLKQAGVPLDGTADFEFSLWRDATSTAPADQIDVTIGRDDVLVVGGQFTVWLDFGPEVFYGDARWLEVAVRVPHDASDTAPYSTLAPRHELTPTPYALHATSAGSVSWNSLTDVPPELDDGDDVEDADADPTNELNSSLALNGTDLEITDAGGTLLADLSSLAGSSDGHSLDAADGAPVNVVRVHIDGNVGIGTAVPIATLDVNGDLNVAGEILGDRIRLSTRTLTGWGEDTAGVVSQTPTGAFTDVATGGLHGVAIRSDGTLVSWGDDHYGQVSQTPTGAFTDVAAGTRHSMAIRGDGTLVSWGSDYYGQVSDTPAGTFTAVAAGEEHSLAIRSDGTLVSWGSDIDGQVSQTPTGTFTAVATGMGHCVAIRSDGTLASWGTLADRFPPPTGAFTAVAGGAQSTAWPYARTAHWPVGALTSTAWSARRQRARSTKWRRVIITV